MRKIDPNGSQRNHFWRPWTILVIRLGALGLPPSVKMSILPWSNQYFSWNLWFAPKSSFLHFSTFSEAPGPIFQLFFGLQHTPWTPSGAHRGFASSENSYFTMGLFMFLKKFIFCQFFDKKLENSKQMKKTIKKYLPRALGKNNLLFWSNNRMLGPFKTCILPWEYLHFHDFHVFATTQKKYTKKVDFCSLGASKELPG